MADKLSIGEAAKYLGVSRDTLRRWEKKGKITPERSPSNRRYYLKEELEILIRKPKIATKKGSSQPSISKQISNPLKLVIYSLLAVLAAVILVLALQIYVF